MSSSSSLSQGKCHSISLDEIKDATDNFNESNVIGKGGEGKVYLGKIKYGSNITGVAVKHLHPNSEEFHNEIKTISKIQHPNLVSILGYCDESNQKIILYEYMEKGSLADYVKKKNSFSLSWVQRLRICLDAALGLQHLHAKTDEFPKGIIHRDVKPNNILLGKDWVAKISDFGLLKLSNAGQVQSSMITNLKGTVGYYAPEYVTYNTISRKIDVYAFGVVLFEVLCLKMPWDRGDESYYSTDDEDLGLWARKNVDTKIKAEISDKSLKVYTSIIGKSLKKDPKKRPTMDVVVLDLRKGLKCQEREDKVMNATAAREPDQHSTAGSFLGSLRWKPRSRVCGTVKREVTVFTDIGVPLTLENVVLATGSFNASNCIGNGNFGATYKAEISPGVLAAVKRISVGHSKGVQQFDAEIKTLGRLRHPNLVTLIGYHACETEMFLIYNYLPGGNLEKYLQERSTNAVDWRILHKIALDVARALAYLHDQCVPCVLHCDVKPSNILLDDDHNAYLSDFGLARLLGTSETHATTSVAGTLGYIAPEYAMTCRVSDKADVYSYGVVLLELISDKKALDPSFSSYGNGFNIVQWASMLFRQQRAKEIFTLGLWDVAPHDDLIEVLHLAVMCTSDALSIRCTMKKVVRRLEEFQPHLC